MHLHTCRGMWVLLDSGVRDASANSTPHDSSPHQLEYAPLQLAQFGTQLCQLERETHRYSSIPGNRNWQIETADWNLDVRLDI